MASPSKNSFSHTSQLIPSKSAESVYNRAHARCGSTSEAAHPPPPSPSAPHQTPAAHAKGARLAFGAAAPCPAAERSVRHLQIPDRWGSAQRPPRRRLTAAPCVSGVAPASRPRPRHSAALPLARRPAAQPAACRSDGRLQPPPAPPLALRTIEMPPAELLSTWLGCPPDEFATGIPSEADGIEQRLEHVHCACSLSKRG